MIRNPKKIDEVVEHLIDYQLKPHNLTMKDVVGVDNWYMKYTTTKEGEDSFIKYATDYIRKHLKMTKKLAEREVSMFILQYGLRVE
jgi:predicted SnoaL-like aldol condensation-catalyzing enzyme